MQSHSQFFEEFKHPEDIDEIYHLFSSTNISDVFYWNTIFQQLSKDKISFNALVECGVGRGRSLLIINQLLDIYLKTKLIRSEDKKFFNEIKVYGLDSFKGFPKPTKFDSSYRNPKEGEWSRSPSGKYEYNVDFTKRIFKKSGVTQEHLELIKGFFSETTFELKTKNLKIGILHLDGDLYESIKQPLDNLSQFVVRGGYIVFDDFILNSKGEDAFPGARKAYEEFNKINKDNYKLFPTLKGNVVLKKK